MSVTEFSSALNQVATERGIPVEKVLDSIKLALVSAYKKDYGEGEDEGIVVDLNPDTGEAKILKGGKDVTPAGFGRIAAQTAKQVILQNIRESEKEMVMDEYKEKIGTIVSGTVFRIDKDVVVLDLGKAHGILPPSEQVSTEQYRTNQRLKVYVKDVKEGVKGPEIVVSRADPAFIEKLFEQEVPEIVSGVVTIEAIAREAGSRTKMAVSSSDEKVDPVGSCVGQKGVRVQSIISEIFGEKIDIIPYSPNIERFVAAALSPARVTEVELDVDEKKAIVSVPEDQQSLAIGKEGQNARLANKLTKWKIDIKGAPGLFGAGAEDDKGEEDKVVRGVWDAEIAKKAETKDEGSGMIEGASDDVGADSDEEGSESEAVLGENSKEETADESEKLSDTDQELGDEESSDDEE